MYSLCLVGDKLSNETTQEFDACLRSSFGEAIQGRLEGDSWEQAQCNIRDGGYASPMPMTPVTLLS